MLTLNLGTGEQFRLLREGLAACGFDEAAICSRAGCKSIFEFRTTFEDKQRASDIVDVTDLLIRLLMDGELVDAEKASALLPPDLAGALLDLNVIAKSPRGETQLISTVFLYPVHGIYVVSDRTIEFDQPENAEAPVDLVYPAITDNTGRFLANAPERPCETLLDLCSGTGIAALRAAKRFAGHAWACDITERAVHFAEFARRLNGIENVTVARGDLYEPVRGLQFDRILAHPPYVPAYGKSKQYYFRDGGDDGEQILRGVIQGLPDALKPGGRLYCQTMATDREGESFGDRIRKWLGPHAGEFDVVLISDESALKPDGGQRKQSAAGQKMLDKRRELFETLHVTSLFYGTVVIERRETVRPVVHARTAKTPLAASAAIEWLVEWEKSMVGPEALQQLLNARPRLADETRLVITHRKKDGQLQPDRFEVKSFDPFIVDALCQPWVALLLGYCDGTRPAGAIYEEMVREGAIEESMNPTEFAGVMKLLLSGAVLELDDFPPPRAAPRKP